MARKPISEKIENIQAEIQQKENLLKKLLQQQKEKDKKARTHRLIERGAILESLIGNPETLTNEQIKTLLERTVGSSYGAKTLDSIRWQDGGGFAHRAEVTQGEGS